MNHRSSLFLSPQPPENEFPFPDNPKDEIESLEKWFNDNRTKLKDKQDNITKFVQGKIRKIKAEALEKNVKIEDPTINQELVNYTIHDFGDFLEKIQIFSHF